MKDKIILIVKEAIANHTWSDKDDYAPNTDIYRIDSEDIDHIAEQVADELLKIKITLPVGRCNGKISEVLNFLSDLVELQEYRQKIEQGRLIELPKKVYEIGYCYGWEINEKEIGEDVFLTKEEAEAELAELLRGGK